MLSLLSPGHLTLLALRPCFPLPCSWIPAPDHPRQPGPTKARLFWKSVGRRQNVRSVSSLQTGAPAPGQTAAVSVCPQRPVFSFQARRSRAQAAVWGTSPTRWAYGGEARTDWAMTSQPPARLGPPTPWQGGQTKGSPRTTLPSPLLPHRTFHWERWNLHSEKLLPSTGTFPSGSWGCPLLLLADPADLHWRDPPWWSMCCAGQVAPVLAQDQPLLPCDCEKVPAILRLCFI